MTNLGFWQLNRAEEKEGFLALLADNTITPITERQQIKQLPRYANVKLNGHYLQSPQLLLDNQVDQQVLGYHVFTPFVLDDLNMTIMVNRGWVAKKYFSDTDLNINSQTTQIAGKLNNPPQVGIQLGEIELKNNQTQQVITYYQTDKISTFLHQQLCSDLNCIVSNKILWLKADQPQGFKRDWNPIVMLPSKHTAYAVQWFAMTFVLILIFVYWLRKA
jgi:surfeit locus 1 family protein